MKLINYIRKEVNFTNEYFTVQKSLIFDLLRVVAALMVLFNHIRNIFFVSYSNSNGGIINKIFYLIFGLGHQAVIVFFVLSGFFITNSIMKSYLKGNWSWKKYLIDRFTRLYIVLIPALIITLILDEIGMYMFNYKFFPHDMHERISIISLLGNLIYLQNIRFPIFGSNDPLWSLAYEFWYYMLFPLIFFLIFEKSKINLKIVYSLLIFMILVLVDLNLTKYFLIWLMGGSLIIIPKKIIRTNLLSFILIVTSILLLLIMLIGTRLIGIDEYIADLILAFFVCFFMYIILIAKTEYNYWKSSEFYNFSRKIIKSSADFSFTLYLIHFPILIFIYSIFYYKNISKMELTIKTSGIFLILVIVTVLSSYILSLITERKTNEVKLLFYKKILRTHKRY